MTATSAETMTALQDLLSERAKYQGWIAALDERRSSTPTHVYDRVHTDYALRLERVMQRLSERAGLLDSTIGALSNRLGALREREADKTDERHESELRAAVGEFDEEEWEKRRSALDIDLKAIASERESVEAELAELQRVVALTRTSGSADAGQRSTESPKKPSQAENEEPTQSIEDFVAEWPDQHASPPEASSQGDGVPEVPEVDGVIGAVPAAHNANPIGAAGAHYGLANGIGGGTPPRGTMAEPPPVPAALADTDKTLRCPECGTMNYATEWYCERCGGELSTF